MANKRKPTKQPKPRKPIPRQTRKFQLRRDHPIDSHVAEILDYKRQNRQEVTVIRDGVRLMWALENNDFSVLFELFPKAKEQLTGGGGGGQLDQIQHMLEIIAAGRKQGELVMQSAQPSTGKQIAGFKALAAPTFESDDEPLTIPTKEAAGTNIGTLNFLNQFKELGATKAVPKPVVGKAKAASADV